MSKEINFIVIMNYYESVDALHLSLQKVFKGRLPCLGPVIWSRHLQKGKGLESQTWARVSVLPAVLSSLPCAQ